MRDEWKISLRQFLRLERRVSKFEVVSVSECIVTESSAPAALPRQSAQIGRPDRPGSASFAPPASGDHLPGTTTVPYSSTSPSAATDRIGRPACVLARPLAPSFPMKTWLNAIFFCRCGTITVSAPPGIPPLHSFLLVIDIAGARHPGWIRSGGISAIRALFPRSFSARRELAGGRCWASFC